MSCIITDTCAHCRTIFVCKGHCPYTCRHGQQQPRFIDSTGCTERSTFVVERNGFVRREDFPEEGTRHYDRSTSLGRTSWVERPNFLGHARCLERRDLCQRQQSQFKQHPTPFGIRNILGLGDSETSTRNDVGENDGILLFYKHFTCLLFYCLIWLMSNFIPLLHCKLDIDGQQSILSRLLYIT